MIATPHVASSRIRSVFILNWTTSARVKYTIFPMVNTEQRSWALCRRVLSFSSSHLEKVFPFLFKSFEFLKANYC